MADNEKLVITVTRGPDEQELATIPFVMAGAAGLRCHEAASLPAPRTQLPYPGTLSIGPDGPMSRTFVSMSEPGRAA